MANVVKIPFTLFEPFETTAKGVIRRRTLRFDLNALADFEQEVGMGFAQLMKSRAIFATARAMLWAGLKHEDSALTIERVGDLLTDFMQQGGKVDEALQVAFKAAMDQGALGRPEPEPESVAEVPEKNAPGLAVVSPVLPMPSEPAE